jgi:hypothetical protein
MYRIFMTYNQNCLPHAALYHSNLPASIKLTRALVLV